MDFESISVSRSYEQVVEQIRERIASGALSVGQRLPTEPQLADSFGVSRGVIREALRVLVAMGLVESRQGSGTFITGDRSQIVTHALTLSVAPEERSVGRLFEFRELLEAFAAERAAEFRSDAEAAIIRELAEATVAAAAAGDIPAFSEADGPFHEAICTAADNPYLAVTVKAIREMHSDVVIALKGPFGSIEVASDHHLRIAEAIAAKDSAAARAAMHAHIRYTATEVARLVRQVQQSGNERGEDDRNQ